MTAGISVDLGSATPPYEQIRAQISSLIALGALAPGTRLPTVRSLAADLGIAAGTVARAYRELEQAGLIDTRRRNGTVVAGTPADETESRAPATTPAPGAVAARVTAAVEHYIAEGRRADFDDAALLAILRAKLSQQDG
ncbi:GntR family transcriptional regulator [Arthrobacter sp. UYEF36]|uniref:GntR family transcriptional regulator n=1 Tax=Arthrobacter sp. UYEF36 TaxID=1756366 RepID=UPI003390EB2E